jgi:hypothetical protein
MLRLSGISLLTLPPLSGAESRLMLNLLGLQLFPVPLISGPYLLPGLQSRSLERSPVGNQPPGERNQSN